MAKNKKQIKDPFDGLILDKYEQEIEDSIVSGDYVRGGDFIKRKSILEASMRSYLDKAKTKQISLLR